MPEEAQEGLENALDNPEEAPEEEGTTQETEEPDYRSQYEELRSKFNERDTEISEARELRQLAEELEMTPAEFTKAYRDALAQAEGLEEESDEEEEVFDPGQVALQRLQEMEANQQAQARQEEADQKFLGLVEQLEEKEGIEFTTASVRFLYHEAMLAGRNPEDAFKDLQATYEEGQNWQKGRKAQKQKAAKAPSGSSGSREEVLDTDEKRRAALEREIEAAQASAD